MITSTHNPKIHHIRTLMGKALERRAAGRFVIEGVRLVEEAAQSGIPVDLVLYSDTLSERGSQILHELERRGAAIEETAGHVLASLSDTETSQGILAVAQIPDFSMPSDLNFALLADTIRDPGNLGAILRTAAAAGVQAALLSPATADPYAPKVVRAGMGAQFRLPIFQAADWDQIRGLLKNRPSGSSLAVLQSEAEGKQTLWETDLRQPIAVMVSNEAEGTSPDGRELSDISVRIPMPGKTESLNAAVAAGILLFETVRQRTARQN